MPADSLLDMTRRVAARNVHKITDLGPDITYDLIRPVLLKLENPEKLHQLELSSPQLIGHTSELWLNFLKRDIPDYQLKRHEPSNPKNWYKVYKKLKAEASKDSSDAEAMLKAALSSIKSEKEQNTAEIAGDAMSAGLYSSTNAPGPSRKGRINWAYMSGKTGAKGANKMTLMEKIRKEAKGARTGKMGRPTHELQRKQNGVFNAPAQFVEDVKKMKALQQMEAKKVISPPPKRLVPSVVARTSTPPIHAPRGQVPKREPQPAAASGVQPYDLTSDREARLRALKMGKPMLTSTTETASSQAQKSTPTGRQLQTQRSGDANSNLTLDFLESESDDELFGNDRPSKKRQRDDEDDIPPPRKMLKPTIVDDHHPPRKPLKPSTSTDDQLRPRSRSPLKLSPAPSRAHGSPRLQPVRRKHEAPSLFHTSSNKRLRPA